MKIIVFISLMGLSMAAYCQGGAGADPNLLHKLPELVQPSPEVTNLFRATQLSANLASGSPNISIPLIELPVNSYQVRLTLNYNSTGIRVDDYASMLGMGWTLNFGGVITRTILGAPDESRYYGTNTNWSLGDVNFLASNAHYNIAAFPTDMESDVFSFSLPGLNGKFILNQDNSQVIQTSNQHLRIRLKEPGYFPAGFDITTDDGTIYYFESLETITNRQQLGTICDKTSFISGQVSAWSLSRIVLASSGKTILFSYLDVPITYEYGLQQTVSKCISSELNEISCPGMSGAAFPVGGGTITTCVSRQKTMAKFISRIQSSDGDLIEFIYDAKSREDLENAKRLSGIRLVSRTGQQIKSVSFLSGYRKAVNSSMWTSNNSRLFLYQLSIADPGKGPLVYTFEYNQADKLPSRLSYAQDEFGYFNGRLNNLSLIPILPATDINFSHFPKQVFNGVYFGDRSIDTVFSAMGLLTKIIYPTGGFDKLVYVANRVRNLGSIKLAGGFSLQRIVSYLDNEIAREKFYQYVDEGTVAPSTMLVDAQPVFSVQNTIRKSNFQCNQTAATGPKGTFAVISTNSQQAIAILGGQHLFHTTVIESESIQGSTGYSVHHFQAWNNGNLRGQYLTFNKFAGLPFQVINDLIISNDWVKEYRKEGNGFRIHRKTEVAIDTVLFKKVPNYFVRRTHEPSMDWPSKDFLESFDIGKYYINCYTVRTRESKTTEHTYNNTQPIVNSVSFEYTNTLHCYPTKETRLQSDGTLEQVQKKYMIDDASTYGAMISRNILSPLIEQIDYKGGKEILKKTWSYRNLGPPSNIVALEQVESIRPDKSLVDQVTFSHYDGFGNVGQLLRRHGSPVSYIYGYNASLPVAKVSNALASEIAYTSFETYEMGGWVYPGTASLHPDAPTGRKVYPLLKGEIRRAGLDPAQTYKLTYWRNSINNPINLAGNQIAPSQGRTLNGWTYYEHLIKGQTKIVVSGDGMIDELRMYPHDAEMTTYSYEPLRGIQALSDRNSRINYFNYDESGRLLMTRNQNKEILSRYCYTYPGQSASCQVYTNDVVLKSAKKNDCGLGYSGSEETVTIPAGLLYATTKELANSQATDLATSESQLYANATGYCFIPCTSVLCVPGISVKCVNNKCETGAKIYTTIKQISPKLYECSFYYRWSDGVVSQTYVEQSTTSCALSNTQ